MQSINQDKLETITDALLYNIWEALQERNDIELGKLAALEKISACNYKNAILTQERR